MLLGTRYGIAKYVESVPANRDIQVKLDDLIAVFFVERYINAL